MTPIEIIITIIGGGSLLSFVGSLITLIANRREAKARTLNIQTLTENIKVQSDKLQAEKEKLASEIGAEYQHQINELVIRNGELFEKMEAQRIAYEKRLDDLEQLYEKREIDNEKTIHRLSRDITHLQDELRTDREALQSERKRAVMLEEQLQIQSRSHAEELKKFKSDMEVVKLKTGKMPLPQNTRLD